MRSEILIHRWVLAAAVLTLAACASHETWNAPQRPNGRPGGSGLRANGGKPKPQPPAPNMSPEETMNREDANKDGTISLQENMDLAMREADMRFSKMDRDHDGRLTSQELADADKRRQTMKPDDKLRAGGNGRQQPPGPQSLLTRADTNHDGAVDGSENRSLAQQQATKRFQARDKNGDGRLELSEMQAR